MKQITVMEKYPVFTLEVNKNETRHKTIDEILAYLKEQIEAHPVATYIGEFDHYAHTKSLEAGQIADEIKAAKILFVVLAKCCQKLKFWLSDQEVSGWLKWIMLSS